jgi:hypothetical protein
VVFIVIFVHMHFILYKSVKLIMIPSILIYKSIELIVLYFFIYHLSFSWLPSNSSLKFCEVHNNFI